MSKVGFTCSCFDLFHAGHIMMLKEAKSICDYLIVGLQMWIHSISVLNGVEKWIWIKKL